MSKKETFDQMSMTGRELKDMQKVVDGKDDAAQVHALYWIAKRRENKTLTYDEVLDTVSLAEAFNYLGLDTPLPQS